MTIQESYARMGGNYDDVMSRLRADDRVKRFLLKVADDKSFATLCDMLAAHNMEEAFRAAHTLKGVSSNLSLTRLYDAAHEITEALRGKTEYDPAIEPLLDKVKEVYALTIECIHAID